MLNNEFLSEGNGRVVCLSGSTRFKDEFIRVERELTLKGWIVLPLGVFEKADGEEFSDKTIEMLFENHLKKIRMSDVLFVVDKDLYVGESTRKEIKYAQTINVPVVFMEDDSSTIISYPVNPNLEEKSWQWFQDTGLILQINQILHMFGIAITVKRDDFGNLIKAYPARTKFRGFGEKSIDKSYAKVANYLKDNSGDLLKDIDPKEPDANVEFVDETLVNIPDEMVDTPVSSEEINDINELILQNSYKNEYLKRITKEINDKGDFYINFFRYGIDEEPEWFVKLKENFITYEQVGDDKVIINYYENEVSPHNPFIWAITKGSYIINSNIKSKYTPSFIINKLSEEYFIEFVDKLINGKLHIFSIL